MPGSNGTQLSRAEVSQLARCEAEIERVLEDARSLATPFIREIRDNRLYRATHATFEAYCRVRWDFTPQHVNRMIASDEIASRNQLVPPPTRESQVRPLAALPDERQAEAWKEAVDRSGGEVPTAKVVKQVVERIMGTRVNGVLQEDPDDVHRDRLAGRIGRDIIVDVTEHDAPEEDEAPPPPAEVSDEEWVAALPLHAELVGNAKRTFRDDALAYRHMDAARKTYQHHLSRLPKPRRRGPWRWAQDRAMRLEPPDRWVVCPAAEHGGCSGSGHTQVGNCPKCHGSGYLIP